MGRVQSFMLVRETLLNSQLTGKEFPNIGLEQAAWFPQQQYSDLTR